MFVDLVVLARGWRFITKRDQVLFDSKIHIQTKMQNQRIKDCPNGYLCCTSSFLFNTEVVHQVFEYQSQNLTTFPRFALNLQHFIISISRPN